MVLSVKGPAKLWILIWVFSSWNQLGLSMLQPMMPTAASIPQFASHSDQVCSTWGNYHFKTFAGDIYHFPGTCNYVFASHCKSSSEDFNIQIRRSIKNSVPLISHITARIDGVVVEILNKSIMMDGVLITEIPSEKSRVHIDKIGVNLRIAASSGLVLLWNGEDSLQLKLNRNKYANQTCGMCGDFNDVGGFTMMDGIKLTPVQFGNFQKVNGPMEDCPDVSPPMLTDCIDEDESCKKTLTSAAFSSCNTLLEPLDYIDACVKDLCRCTSENCIKFQCTMFSEYSHQCSHAGGVPGNWRSPKLCTQSCPFNMVFQEHGSPCPNTCSNTERSMLCEDHGIDGCFCPPGTVLDDINNTGCVPQEECFCVYNSETYAPGSTYSTICRACKCSGGKWKCKELSCRGSCSVEGGTHITSFDGTRYSIHMDCSYVLAKHCSGDDFTLLGDIRRCGITNTKSCLKSVILSLNKGETVLAIKDSGIVFLNSIPIQMPLSVADLTVYAATSFYINVALRIGVKIQVQTVPFMQVYITLDPSYQDQTCGLCGNFNNIQTDDFKAISGVIEGTAAAFVNTWKTLTNCPNIKNSYEDPCSLSLEKEKYAQHWCSLLTSVIGPFSPCHSLENPLPYFANCLSDTCSSQDSEEGLCAALSSYAYACAKKSVSLFGWRNSVCQKYTKICKESQSYHYNVTRCQTTCRSLSEADVTCSFEFDPVDGCVCKDGTYMNDNGDCVLPSSCPCYYQGKVMEAGEMITENGVACTCEKGQLNCMGALITKSVCPEPLVYFDCTKAPKGSEGVECQRSCHTLDMDCYSSQCISGCVCPDGLISDGNGGCITQQQCPCFHNEATFSPGTNIQVGCNTCTCKNRKWQCTHKRCLGTCSIYGDGHYITFDNKQFTFSGSCEYTLAQDNCGDNGGQSTFRVITENVPCGTTGTTCSKNIKFFIMGYELRLNNEKIEVVRRDDSNTIPYEVMHRGMYLVINSEDRILLIWDQKMTIHIKLSPDFQKKVCGLCGNYDGIANNDFTTRSQSVVENLMEFGNSWKTDPQCPNAFAIKEPCSINPYRKAWALKQCGIITSKVFQPCHSQVDPGMYFESCISDSCACDSGGDCECFCTAVALYAQACSENGVCINWRTPTICPMFCDYYNDVGDCEWHYKPCGDKCMKTCRYPKGKCLYELSGCEGCYPKCPATKPYFNEETMKCVAWCGCSDINGNLYNYGEKVPTEQNCQSCECSIDGIRCQYDSTACRCEYNGKLYNYTEVIPSSSDEHEKCTQRKCDLNGEIIEIKNICQMTTVISLPQEITDKPYIVIDSSFTVRTSTFPSITTKESSSASTTFTYSMSPNTPNTSFKPSTSAPLFKSTYQIPLRTETSPVTLPLSVPPRTYTYLTKIPTSKTTIPNYSQKTTRNIIDISSILTTLSTTKEKYISKTVDSKSTSNSQKNDTISGTSTQSPPLTSAPATSSVSLSTPKSTNIPSTSTKISIGTTTYPTTLGRTLESIRTSSKTTSTSTITSSPKSCFKCHWTEWINTNYPTSEKNGGDQENFEIAERNGINVCRDKKYIQDIECRASSYPNKPIEELNQPISCDIETGLQCKNKDIFGPWKMCYNYEIRYHCCDVIYDCFSSTSTTTFILPMKSTSHYPSLKTTKVTTEISNSSPSSGIATTTFPVSSAESFSQFTNSVFTTSNLKSSSNSIITSTISGSSNRSPPLTSAPATSSVSLSTPKSTNIPSKSTKISIGTITYPTTLGRTSESIRMSSKTSSTSTIGSSPKSCFKCHWTEWIDTNYPTSEKNGGDQENFEIAERNGINVCRDKKYIQDIECRASSYPNKPIEELSQPISCDIETGLQCKNKDILGPWKMCYNYEIRYHCCDVIYDCFSSTSTTTSILPMKSTSHYPSLKTTKVTTEISNSSPSSGIATTTFPVSSAESFSQFTNSVFTTSNLKSNSNSIITSTISGSSNRSPPLTSAPATSSVSLSTPKSTNIPSKFTKISIGTITHPTTLGRTSESIRMSSKTSSTSTIGSSPKSCFKCHWTEWIDTNYPTSEKNGGDQENFEIAERNGINVCRDKKYIQDIECRATSYPNKPIKELSQPISCDIETGLQCKNKDILGPWKMCYNYEIRYHCCDVIYDCFSSTSTTTSILPMKSTSHYPSLKTTKVTTKISNSSPSSGIATTTFPVSSAESFSQFTNSAFTTSNLKSSSNSIITSTISGSANRSPPLTSAPATSSVSLSTPKSTNIPSKSTKISIGTITYPTTLGRTSESIRMSSKISSTSTIGSSPKSCFKCHWTEWIDTNYPTSEKNGGDQENFEIAEHNGINVCRDKKYVQDIECRASSYPNKPIEELNQPISCDIETGLQCKNKDILGPWKMCYNYEIRYHCCDVIYDCFSSTSTTTSILPMKSTSHYPSLKTTKVTTEISNSSPSSGIATTTFPVSSAESFSQFTNSVFTTSNLKSSSNSIITSTISGSSNRSPPLTSAPATSSVSLSTPKSTNIPSKSTKISIGTITYPTTLGRTSESIRMSSKTSSTSTIGSSPKSCFKCHWTEWIDTNYPTSEKNGGDQENFEIAERNGINVCRDKKYIQDIECRATSYPNKPIKELSQPISCDIETGLQCKNKDILGPWKMCYNYEIRYHCCDVIYDCFSSTSTTTSILPMKSTSHYPSLKTTKVTTKISNSSPSSGIATTTFPVSSAESFSQFTNSVFTTSNLKSSSNSIITSTISGSSNRSPPLTSAPATSFVSLSTPKSTNIPSKSTKISIGTITYPTTLGRTSESIRMSSKTSSTSTIGSSPKSCFKCHWTEWIDTNYPTSEKNGGDQENFEIAERNGINVCRDKKYVQDIECRASSYPNKPIEELNQPISCDIETGLQCKNKDILGPWKMCYNYEIRYHCCDVIYDCFSSTSTTTFILPMKSTSHYPSLKTTKVTTEISNSSPSIGIATTTFPVSSAESFSQFTNSVFTTSNLKSSSNSIITSTISGSSNRSPPLTSAPATSSVSLSTPKSTNIPSKSTKISIGTITYPTTLGRTSESIRMSSKTSSTSTIGSSPKSCFKCHWTEWIDTNYPTSEKNGGDQENFEIAERNGINVCRDKKYVQDIECRASSYPNKPIEELNQPISCDIETGLQCKNKDILGPWKMCYNYEIRYHCCDVIYDCFSSTSTTTSILPMKSTSHYPSLKTTKVTTEISNSSPSSGIATTTFPVSSAESFSQFTNSAFTTSNLKSSSNSIITSTISGSSNRSPPLTSAPATSSVSLSTPKSTNIPSKSTKISIGTITYPTTLGRTSESIRMSSKISSTSTIGSSPKSCFKCHWTEWIDTNYPTSEKNGGDQENFEIAEHNGINVCRDKKYVQDIECRASSYPNKPIEELNQPISCDIETGLQCKNKDILGPWKMCYNYEIRYHCCDVIYDCFSSTSTTTSILPMKSTSHYPSLKTTKVTTEISNSSPSSGIATTTFPVSSAESFSQFTNSVFTTSNLKSSSNSIITSTISGSSNQSPPLTSAPATSSVSLSTPKSTNIPSKSTKISIGTITYPTTLGRTSESIRMSSKTSSTSTIGSSPKSCFKCHWTEWIDTNYPTSEKNGGDQENFEIAERNGINVCRDKKYVQDIECRASSYPNKPIEELNQPISCDIETGLQCKNKDILGPWKMCYNYEIRYHCCDVIYDCFSSTSTTTSILPMKSTSHYPSLKTTKVTTEISNSSPSSGIATTTFPVSSAESFSQFTNSAFTTSNLKSSSNSIITSTISGSSNRSPPLTSAPATSSVSLSTPKSTNIPSTSTKISIGTITYPTTLGGTSESIRISSKTSSTSTIGSSPKSCFKCHWTEWIDTNYPTSEKNGGDQENFEIAERNGINVCRDKKYVQDIECRASSYPNKPIEELNQPLSCDIEKGLQCKNKDILGPWKMCYNYEIRYHCCDVIYDCFSSTSTTTSILPMKSTSHYPSLKTTKVTTEISNSSPSSGIATTTFPVSSAESFSQFTNSVFTTSNLKSSSNSIITSTISGTSNRSPPLTSAPATSSVSLSTPKSTNIPSTSTKISIGTTTYPTTLGRTSESLRTSSKTTSTSTITSSPKSCFKCHWTEWIDTNYPTSEKNGGDQENFEIAEGNGINVCRDKKYVQDIECRASSYPNIPIEELNQPISCDIETGLQCKNKDILGPWKMCYNYQIRYHCCDIIYICPTPVLTHTATAMTDHVSSIQTSKISKAISSVFSSMSMSTPKIPVSSVTTSLSSNNFISTSLLPKSSSFSTTSKMSSTDSTRSIASSTSTEVLKTTPTVPYLCLYNGSTYEMDSSIPSPPESCEDCKCTKTMKNTAEITCKPVVCQTDCPLGFTYKKIYGQCCGKCVQSSCILNNSVLIKPGSLWRPPGDNCTSYECEPNTFIVIKRVMSCPAQKPVECEKGIVVDFTSTDGCCTIQYCEPRKCDVMKSWKIIESGECSANVTLTNCGGYCSSVSRHPNFPKMEEHDCTCCQASETTSKNIQLQCANEKTIEYTFTDILKCACRGAACVFTE